MRLIAESLQSPSGARMGRAIAHLQAPHLYLDLPGDPVHSVMVQMAAQLPKPAPQLPPASGDHILIDFHGLLSLRKG